jgi:hypothetical protein
MITKKHAYVRRRGIEMSSRQQPNGFEMDAAPRLKPAPSLKTGLSVTRQDQTGTPDVPRKVRMNV